jgi:CDGSH-type Zn-finger protein
MKTKVTIKSNSALVLEGEDLELYDAEGNRYDLGGRTRVSLCRCGLSANKPFCDGAHKDQFVHEAKAFALPPKP